MQYVLRLAISPLASDLDKYDLRPSDAFQKPRAYQVSHFLWAYLPSRTLLNRWVA